MIPASLGKHFGHRHAGNLRRDRSKRAANLFGSVGFGVPGVELGRPADQEEEDAIQVATALDGSLGLERLERGKPEAEQPSDPACKKSRRVSPSQNRTVLSASTRNMLGTSFNGGNARAQSTLS